MITKNANGNNTFTFFFTLLFTIGILYVVAGHAIDKTKSWPKVEYSHDAETPVIVYHQIPEQLAGLDPTPRLQVYGDGRVLIHYPAFMKRAGDYEIYLDSAEMQRLIDVIVDIVEFDTDAVTRDRNNAEIQKQREDGEFFMISDYTKTIIEIQLDSYQATENSFAEPLKKKVAWKNLHSDVTRYPDIRPLQELAFCEQTIRELLRRDDMTLLEGSQERR